MSLSSFDIDHHQHRCIVHSLRQRQHCKSSLTNAPASASNRTNSSSETYFYRFATMPGSARRLKKKLQEVASPSPPTSSSTSPNPTQNGTGTGTGTSPKSGSISEGISNLLHPNHHHHHKSHSTGQYQNPPQGSGGPGVISNVPVHPVSSAQSAQSAKSVDSVASNPNNYMTDQQLEQDLELEAMADREQYIGNPPPPGQGVPPPMASGGPTHSAPAQLPPPSSGSVPPPPPEEQKSGGMYGSGLFGNHGNGGGGKKKSSKQKFAERQVGLFQLVRVIPRLEYQLTRCRRGRRKLCSIRPHHRIRIGQLSSKRRGKRRFKLLEMHAMS